MCAQGWHIEHTYNHRERGHWWWIVIAKQIQWTFKSSGNQGRRRSQLRQRNHRVLWVRNEGDVGLGASVCLPCAPEQVIQAFWNSLSVKKELGHKWFSKLLYCCTFYSFTVHPRVRIKSNLKEFKIVCYEDEGTGHFIWAKVWYRRVWSSFLGIQSSLS